jgi:sugar phosphate isomerase/epimerase
LRQAARALYGAGVTYTRRTLLGAATTAAVAAAQPRRQYANWKPKLGILCQFSDANLEFAKQEGFTSVQLMGGVGLNPLQQDDAVLASIKDKLAKAGILASSLGANGNHIAPDAAVRERTNRQMMGSIEIAGKLGIGYIGTQSGTIPGKPMQEQVDEIVRVYTEKYFPLCQKHNVRILWEPWAGGPNIATGPVAWDALFKAFQDSPYVGLQFDPSHLQWQMMDPVAAAREFSAKIFDVHLKDTEILWHVVKRAGINPVNNAKWWRFRLPGYGSVDWRGFFTVLSEMGYTGAMNIENEDEFYYPAYDGPNFTEQFKRGFRLAHQYLKTVVPEG